MAVLYRRTPLLFFFFLVQVMQADITSCEICGSKTLDEDQFLSLNMAIFSLEGADCVLYFFFRGNRKRARLPFLPSPRIVLRVRPFFLFGYHSLLTAQNR